MQHSVNTFFQINEESDDASNAKAQETCPLLAWEEQFSFTDAQCSRGHARKDVSSFERRGRVVRHWLRSNRRFGSSTTFERMAVQSSTAASEGLTERASGVQTTRTRSNETYRVENAHSARMAENGTTSNPQSIDSRHLADLMTKAMNREKLIKFGRALNLRGAFFTDLSQPAK